MAAQFLGRVIGTKMDKTAKVLVTKLKLHPIVMKVCYTKAKDCCKCEIDTFLIQISSSEVNTFFPVRSITIIEKSTSPTMKITNAGQVIWFLLKFAQR